MNLRNIKGIRMQGINQDVYGRLCEEVLFLNDIAMLSWKLWRQAVRKCGQISTDDSYASPAIFLFEALRICLILCSNWASTNF